MTILTHWGRVRHICIGNLVIIGSDNGLSPGRRQAIIWTNAGILLIGPLWTNFSEILIEIHTLSFKKMYLKISSGKMAAMLSRPQCFNVLKLSCCKVVCLMIPFFTEPAFVAWFGVNATHAWRLSSWHDMVATAGFVSRHGDVMTWQRSPHCWPFVKGIPQLPVGSPYKGPMMPLVWTGYWGNGQVADLTAITRHTLTFFILIKFPSWYWELSTRQLTMQPVLNILSKWYLRFSEMRLVAGIRRNVVILVTQPFSVKYYAR